MTEHNKAPAGDVPGEAEAHPDEVRPPAPAGAGAEGSDEPKPNLEEAASVDTTSDQPSKGNGRPRDFRGRRHDRRRYAHQTRQIPIFRLLGYYAVLTAIAAVLIHYFPVVRRAFLAPLGQESVGNQNPFADAGSAFQALPGNLDRLVITSLVMMGTILLALPVAWVYTFARRLRYERSLVHSLILLPPVVAGTVMVVKHSIALAFSLAGIVAAVRFRTTVKDTKDAVHVFLVMAVGLAAGVQALDIALLLSLTFAIIVLVFWKYDLEVVADDEKELLSVGDFNLMLAQTHEGRTRIRGRLQDMAEDIKTDGILLIHTTEPDSARQVAEVVLSEVGKRWIFKEPPRGRNGVYTLEAVVRLRKKKTPVDLLGQLEDRWSPTVAAAEYVPFQP